MLTSKHDLDSDVSQAELELDYINKGVIAYEHEKLGLEVYVYVSKMGCNEVYNHETLYEIVDRFGSDAVEAYQGNEEL